MRQIALIPAYCPEDRMIALVKELREIGFFVIVIDDGSGTEYDKVFEEARSHAEIQRYSPNRGKGEALKYGLRYIQAHFQPPYTVVTADADGQHRIEDIVTISNIAEQHPDSLVLGKRLLDKSTPRKSRVGNGLTRVFYRLCTGRNIYETQTGLRAFSDRLLPRFLTLPGHRYEYEIDMMLSAADIDIIEEEIKAVYFDNNAGSHFRPLQDTVSLNKEFIRYKIPSLIAGAADYLGFILLMLFSPPLYAACMITRALSLLLKYILNRTVPFSEKVPLPQYIITSLVILSLDTAVTVGLSALGMNPYLAKLLSGILMILVSIITRRIFSANIYS